MRGSLRLVAGVLVATLGATLGGAAAASPMRGGGAEFVTATPAATLAPAPVPSRDRAGDSVWVAATTPSVSPSSAARGTAGEITLIDDRPARVAFPAPPRRIVSLLPSLTEAVCALGACERLVGTDRFSNWPARIADLPKLGGLDDAQIERIVALRPDVVLVAPAARVIDRLEGLGVRVLVFESRNHADVRRTLDTLGQLLGVPERASAAWQAIEAETRAAAAAIPPSRRGSRVYLELDPTPYAAGVGSFVDETLRVLGLRNALPRELGAFPKLSPEYVVRLQPDVVIAARDALVAMPGRPGWSALRALREWRACGFGADVFDVLVRPGPRMGHAARLLADCVAGLPRQ